MKTTKIVIIGVAAAGAYYAYKKGLFNGLIPSSSADVAQLPQETSDPAMNWNIPSETFGDLEKQRNYNRLKKALKENGSLTYPNADGREVVLNARQWATRRMQETGKPLHDLAKAWAHNTGVKLNVVAQLNGIGSPSMLFV